ncbi:MAG: hypothetical protein FWF81_07695 [Defluviitaleaceae bacterium]|nr:hypothetical protein [Defluviitaleaceae bacterium]
MQFSEPTPTRHINGGLLFIFSFFFPPGANYMYMGLIKRGLAAMCGFFLLIYLMIVVSGIPATALFALSLPVLWLTCFFDSFNIRRKINAGDLVEDGVSDIINGVLRNKPLAIGILVVAAMVFMGTIAGFMAGILQRAVPLLLVLLALYIIFKRKK